MSGIQQARDVGMGERRHDLTFLWTPLAQRLAGACGEEPDGARCVTSPSARSAGFHRSHSTMSDQCAVTDKARSAGHGARNPQHRSHWRRLQASGVSAPRRKPRGSSNRVDRIVIKVQHDSTWS